MQDAGALLAFHFTLNTTGLGLLRARRAATGPQISLAKPMLKLLEKECHARQQTMRPNVGQVPGARLDRFRTPREFRIAQHTRPVAVFCSAVDDECLAQQQTMHPNIGQGLF